MPDLSFEGRYFRYKDEELYERYDESGYSYRLLYFDTEVRIRSSCTYAHCGITLGTVIRPNVSGDFVSVLLWDTVEARDVVGLQPLYWHLVPVGEPVVFRWEDLIPIPDRAWSDDGLERYVAKIRSLAPLEESARRQLDRIETELTVRRLKRPPVPGWKRFPWD